MKTIGEIAEQLGTSRPMLYTVIDNVGVSIDSLTTKKIGNKRLFDENAEEKIKRLYENRLKSAGVNDDVSTVDSDVNNVNDSNNSVIDSLNIQIEELKAESNRQKEEISKRDEEIEKLRAELSETKEQLGKANGLADGREEQIAGLKTRIEKMEKQVSDAMDSVREAHQLADQAQKLHAAQIKKLGDGGEKRGFFARLFGRKKDTESN